jgi:hypothetical protein
LRRPQSRTLTMTLLVLLIARRLAVAGTFARVGFATD